MNAPICHNCGVRECGFDSEGGGPVSYSDLCTRCSMLHTQTEHSHTYYGSPAQVAAGTYRAGHSWQTAVSARAIIENDRHVGYRCTRFELCGWERRYTAAELVPCREHTGPTGDPSPLGACSDAKSHRVGRGEVDPVSGFLTEHGRTAEWQRIMAANWDPGEYVDEWTELAKIRN